MNALFDSELKPHHRFRDGRLVTRGRSRVKWSRISPGGKVHHVVGVIIRWNFHGGTFERPDVTFMMDCGPQRRTLIPAERHSLMERCARCDGKYRGD